MSKANLLAIIVLSTIECLINGKKETFLPSKEPQELPEAEAQEAIDRGLAKSAVEAEKLESGDDEGDPGTDKKGPDPLRGAGKDKVNV